MNLQIHLEENYRAVGFMVNAPQFCFKDIIVYETSYVRHIKLTITVCVRLKHPWVRNEGPFLSL